MISLRPIYRIVRFDLSVRRIRGSNVPTAVNLLRTCKIIITVIMSAIMCMKDAAPWKMMVLPTSMLRA